MVKAERMFGLFKLVYMALQSEKAGLPPGSLLHIGEQKVKNAEIQQISFSKDTFERKAFNSLEEFQDTSGSTDLRWVNITGLHDANVISVVGDMFDLHPLLLEDVVDTSIRPKIEEYENCLFMMVKVLSVDDSKKLISVDQISFVLGKDWLITFIEKPNSLYDGLIKRMKTGKGKISEKGLDYLLFRLTDIIIDHYFFVIEHVNDLVLNLEERAIDNSTPELREEILLLKKQLINFCLLYTSPSPRDS